MVVYLPWSSLPDFRSYNYGTIAFVLVSTEDDVLSKDSVGIDDPVIYTMTVPVYSWLTNDTVGRLRVSSIITVVILILLSGNPLKSAFKENLTLSFHFWPIACSIYVETVTAEVRGDNYLLSHTDNTSSIFNTTTPFARPPPTSPLERNWAALMDDIDESDIMYGYYDMQFGSGLYGTDEWLQNRILALLNGTTSTPAQKLGALEADLQSITSIAYSIVFGQIYNSKNSTVARNSNIITVLGQEHVPLGKLQVNGPQLFVGFVCILVLLACVLISSGLTLVTEESGDVYMLSGEVLDLMCLMKNSALPELLNNTGAAPSNTSTRRAEAEKLDVVLVHLLYHHLLI